VIPVSSSSSLAEVALMLAKASLNIPTSLESAWPQFSA